MIKTRLTGEKIPDFDNKITHFIERDNSNDSDGHFMIIGIDNLNNKLYRVIEVDGVEGYMGLLDFLASLNMMDILSFGLGYRTKGCDMRFRQGDVMNFDESSHKFVTGSL